MGILGALFPQWALKRAIAARRLAQVKGLYEAAQPSRTHPYRGTTNSPDSTMQRASGRLRDIARSLDENHDLATGLFDDLVNWTIGTGLTVEPLVLTTGDEPAKDFNRELRLAYEQWSLSPDTTGDYPMGELERLVARSLFRDGEVLIHHVLGGRYPYRTPVPYALELLEADYLPFEWSRPAGNGQAKIVQGVEKDTWGRSLAYHVWKVHPGETGYAYPVSITGEGMKRVSVDQMTHLKFTRRLRQTRGVPILHSVIRRIEDIKEIEDSERIAGRWDADLAAIVRNIPAMGETKSDGNSVHREIESRSGMMVHVFEGEDVDVHTPSRPNAQLESFRNGQIRMVAAGTGTRYSSVARDYNGTYSAQRQELVEGRMSYDKLRNYLIGRFYRPMWRRFVDAAVLGQRLSLRGIDQRSLYFADFRGPPMPWIDPAKEVGAAAEKVEAGFAARHQVIRDFGDDPQTVDKLREMDQAAAEPAESEEDDTVSPDEGDSPSSRVARIVQ